MNTTPDHPDFTALALGEHIHGTPARAVLDAMRTSVTARQEAEQLRDTAAKLSLVLKGQPPQRLDAKRRNAILNADVAAVRARFAAEEREEQEDETRETVRRPVARRQRHGWIFPSIAAAAVAVAAVAVLQLLPGYERTPGPVSPVAKTTGSGESGHRILITTAPPPAMHLPAPGIQVAPSAASPLQEPAPVAQKVAPQSLESTPPAVVRESSTLSLPPIPEVPRTKPPYTNDFRDYASPPRIKK